MISVIVPTIGEKNIAGTMRLILYRAKHPVEIIVVDGDGYALRRVGRENVVKVASERRGRAFSMNQGARLATGSVLLFLHADTELPLHWDVAVMKSLQKSDYGFFNRRFDSAHPLLILNSFFTTLRARLFGTILGDQTLFVTRKVFERVKGFPEQMLFEDVGISKKLLGYRRGFVSSAVVSSARRFLKKGVIRQFLLNQYLWVLYRMKVSSKRLYSLYTGKNLDAVCMLAKYPSLGKVKTRLAATIGKQKALQVYRRCLEMLILEQGGSDFFLGYSPTDQKKEFMQSYPGLQYVAQVSGSLGDRMQALVSTLLNTHRKVVLMGADMPTLTRKRVARAFSLLDTVDIVLGPCVDGGYYLIGMKHEHDVFSGIPWSSDLTLKATLKKIKGLGLSYRLLQTEQDIDTVEDLKLYRKKGLKI
ncbi:MAG: TIGR04282 family arsenosugar biosynthesis glycosyltransferase [Nanoarchaeota archaeon]|nr:TIGR04282 family arsenosugar biosynthesis glycosyltransferase [Nanoarchaeota archaeon]